MNIGLLFVLVFASLVLLRILWRVVKVLFLRQGIRVAFEAIGKKALDQQPDTIRLERQTFPSWMNPGAIDILARPLLAVGFSDCGVYTIDRMPGVKMQILMKENDSMAAFIYEHPKANAWVELSVRYEDGSTSALSNRPTALNLEPSFFRMMRADPSVPTDQLYRRLLAERPPQGIKKVTAVTVVREFEESYMRIMIWQKNRGLSAQEVAAVAKKWLEKKNSGAA